MQMVLSLEDTSEDEALSFETAPTILPSSQQFNQKETKTLQEVACSKSPASITHNSPPKNSLPGNVPRNWQYAVEAIEKRAGTDLEESRYWMYDVEAIEKAAGTDLEDSSPWSYDIEAIEKTPGTMLNEYEQTKKGRAAVTD